ncbi:MAG: ORC1-type DNA replication protein [Promethearchaeota archaeon]|nr:MAG: ORC1-type DNA replication protein [Candidatus Lokiarchaeota archaeon]
MADNFNQKPLDKIFDGFLSGPQIFKNRDVMRATYIPEDLPHRETQIERIGEILATILKGGVPSNIFLYGKTGTGKTAVAMYVLKHLVAYGEELRQKNPEMEFSIPLLEVINCKDVDTDYRIYARLAAKVGEDVPFTGLPTDEVNKRFKDALDSKKQIFIIVLDEIDQLVKKTSKKASNNNALYNITRMNSELRNARVCIIGISNDLKFREYLDSRVLSSLSEEEMVFPPYKATELLDILTRRAAIGFYPKVINDGTIEITAALAAREHGDARRAIDLLRVAGELAERESGDRVTESHVRRAQTLIERDTVTDVVKTLPIQSKLALYSIYLLEKHELTEIYTGDVYTAYTQLADNTNLDKLTQRRVSDLINELDMLGIITAQVISKGRYGRSKKIRLSIPKTIITSILEEDYVIQKLKDFPIEMKTESEGL